MPPILRLYIDRHTVSPLERAITLPVEYTRIGSIVVRLGLASSPASQYDDDSELPPAAVTIHHTNSQSSHDVLE